MAKLIPKGKRKSTKAKRKVTRKPSSTAKDLPQKKRGRKAIYTPEEAGERNKEAARVYQSRVAKARREIGPFDFSNINWERRLECKESLEKFGYTYMPRMFSLPPSDDHIICIAKMEKVFKETGSFSLAMPRAQGKTAWCRGAILWGTLYGYKRFPFFIGSKQPMAVQTLDAIKSYLNQSRELRIDFPETILPIIALENRYNLAKGQIYNGEITHIEWGSDSIRYPSILLTEEEAKPFLQNDPTSIKYLEEYQRFTPATAGINIRTAGIDGSIRGEAEVHPVTLEQPRPDLVLLDDIQKDQRADSTTACDKLIRLIEGAVEGLSEPTVPIGIIMPCTVQRINDVSDTFLDKTKKPQYQGERCPLVKEWPEGLDDHTINIDTEAGKLWLRYLELRNQSLRAHGDIHLATEFYLQNRSVMDKDFRCSWKHRYHSNKDRYKGNAEVSPQQHAMNLRFKSPDTFPAEYQQNPKPTNEGLSTLVSSAQLAERIVGVDRGCVPVDAHALVAFVDVQDESLWYTVVAFSPDFTGVVVDYGVYPEINTRYFRKAQTEGWKLLSREFFRQYPEQKYKAETTRTKGHKARAPFEAKIYYGVTQVISYLLNRTFPRMESGNQEPMKISKLGIDIRWGKANDAIKRAIRNTGRPDVIGCAGQGITPAHRQFEEYTPTKGWLFEHTIHPQIKETKWVWRPTNTDGYYYLATDVNRLKTFLMSRLACPIGTPGALTLFSASPEYHEMFADQVCNSEYPDARTQRGITKEMWELKETRPDNEYLDCLVGCLALGSMKGAKLLTGASDSKPRPTRKARRRLSEIYHSKR